MNKKLFLIPMTSLLIVLNNELGISLFGILLISNMICCIDESCPTPKIPKPKHWGPTISTQRNEDEEPYRSVQCPFCGTEHMVTSTEYRPEAPHLVECRKCSEKFSTL